MTTIAIDGLSEEDFRRAIENRLREDRAAVAVERLRKLIEPYSGPGRPLPQRFMDVTAEDFVITGWDDLGQALESHDRPGRPITGLSVTFGWPGEDAPGPDGQGNLHPHVETGYYSDDAFPFSKSGRPDLLEGYSYHGCTWAADCEAIDSVLSVDGIDDLHGALAALESRLLASESPDEDGIRAGSLGACLLSVLLYQAVRDRIASDGLPRPLCVMAGSNDVYPYFDAPVVGMPEEACKAAEAAEAAEEEPVYNLGIPAPRYSSLLMANIPRARKRMALVLDESETEAASRIARLRGAGLDGANAPAAREPEYEVPAPPKVEASTPLGGEQGIIPIPGGPLMVKKPHGPPVDFRDMLSPREPVSPPPELSQPAPPRFEPPVPAAPAIDPPAIEPPAIEPVQDIETPLSEPLFEVPADLVPPVEPQPEPGFALLEPNLQERLQSLIAAQLAPLPDRSAVVVPETSSPEPANAMECVRFTASSWPDHGEPAIAAPEVEQTPARPTLWSWIRDWFSARR